MVIISKEKIKSYIDKSKDFISIKIIIVFLAFIIPILILYFLDSGSFDYLWKGRAPYYIFLWLFFLEIILGWKKIKQEKIKFWTRRSILSVVVLFFPTLYAISLDFGLYNIIVELGRVVGVPIFGNDEWYVTHSWPFSFEYILFSILFVLSIWLFYKNKGLKTFTVSSFFISGVGIFYMIDTFYPNGTFTLLQSLVPITTSGVVIILNLLGYRTETFPAGDQGLQLTVMGPGGRPYSAVIAWSCAGSHSLFLYSFMILLFLRGSSITNVRKITYIILGAVGTFLVNIFRVVAIYIIGINSGDSPAKVFHEFYGEFFFIAWMFIYLTIIYLLETRILKTNSIKEKNLTSKSLNQG